MVPFDIHAVQTPCYVVDRGLLEDNLRVLRQVADRAGCRILLAQKAFSMHYFYPLIGRYLDGTTASGLFEARLGHEEMRGGENAPPSQVHIYSPAYRASEFPHIADICDHIVFNSLAQWETFGPAAIETGRSCGIRINPECSTQDHAIYDPCAPGSRLGVRSGDFPETLPSGIEGLHFHTLCEQNADALATTLEAVERRFSRYLHQVKWLNCGGGHHITRPDYDRELLVRLVRRIRETYDVEVYLEPGEAVALDAGFLVTQVLDLVQSGDIVNAIVDTSAACHMPDVLEMPYRPPLPGAGQPGEKQHTYRLGGPTCLAGDVIGDYSFDTPLARGGRIVFGDMAIYSMVKNNTFNGMCLPHIYASDSAGLTLVKAFGYNDFRDRLS